MGNSGFGKTSFPAANCYVPWHAPYGGTSFVLCGHRRQRRAKYYVSTETLLEKNPDYILCNDYGSVKAEDTIAALKANPALANLDAVKNNHFITTVLQDVNESVRVADTASRFAQEMYPELFD